MERFRDDDLAATLRALRPAPRPAFAAELDERAAAGFPRQPEEGSAVERLLARARALRPRRVLLPAGATALAAIALATVVVSIDESGSDKGFVSEVAVSEGSGEIGAKPPGSNHRAQIEPFSGEPKPPAASAGAPSSAGGVEREIPTLEAETATSVPDRLSQDSSLSFGDGGRYASGASHRAVQRSAQMVLGAEPAEVGDAAGRVLEAVHANDGIVLQSSVRGGSENDPRAVFDLLIPSAKLSDTLAAFSEIGEVRYRHDAAVDITAPTVTVGEHLRDSRARIDGLLAQLAEADTEAEREAVEAELSFERRRAAALRSRLAGLHRRANLSHVSLRIETGAASPSSDDSSWGIGDALHDAGRILGIAAAVTLVGLAVLAPIALIALLAWLAQRAWLRRARERTLG